MKFNIKNAYWLLLSVFAFVLDQWTKQLTTAHFEYREVLPIFALGNGGFNLTLAHNYGAAFSFLADQSGWQRWFFAGLALAVGSGLTVWLLRLPKGSVLLSLALALLIGGAFGNLYDRAVYGYVIDFLDVFYGAYHWPAFNIADSAICAGAALLLLESFLPSKKA
ncbi:MAG: signal peptidase II [Pseudomonadales bacterium]